MRTPLRLLLTFVATSVVLAACGTQPPATTNYELTVTLAGSGTGAVTSTPGTIDTAGADFADDFAAGTEVTLTATAAAGSSFAGWTDDCISATATCVVTMDAAKSVTATFTLDATDQTEDLTVNVVAGGSSSGSVTSSPAGIDVDEAAGSAIATFDVGATVTLTATAGGFYGWTGGDCDGLSSTTCVVTVGVGEAAVTANFNDVTTMALAVTSGDSEEFLAPSTTDSDRWRTGFSRATSTDLELVFDNDHALQVVGLRFNGVTVPAGARVVTAVMNFVALAGPSTGTSGDVTVTIAGEATLAPTAFTTDPGFTDGSFDISSRTTTSATADWAITGAWVAEETYQSANAANVLQEIVDQTGWAGGDVVFVLSGDGIDTDFRRAYALEGDAAKAPTLLVEYIARP